MARVRSLIDRFLIRINPSLRWRLQLLVVVSLLPAFGLLVHGAFADRHRAEAAAQEEALRLVRRAAREQNYLLDSARQQLSTLAGMSIVRQPEMKRLCKEILGGLLRQHPYFANVGVADRRGDVRCSALPLKKNVNIAVRSYFRSALGRGEFSVGRYQIGRITGRAGINAGLPLYDSNGVAHGVVFVAIDLLKWLGSMSAMFEWIEGSVLLMFDDQGTVLARHPDSEAWAGKSMPDAPLIRHVLAHQAEGSVEMLGLDGVPRLQVYTPIHRTSDGAAYLVVGTPSDAVYEGIGDRFLHGFAVLTLIAILVLTLGSVSANFLIIRPARALIRTTQRLGRGELGTRTSWPHTRDELGTLARSIDQMAENLEQADDNLRRTNRALRTLSAGNRAMLHATSEPELLEEMCRVIVEEGGYPLALVLYRQPPDSPTLTVVASAGPADMIESVRPIRFSCLDDADGQMSIGKAVRSGQTACTRDSTRNPAYAGWRAHAPAFPADISVPLRVHGTSIGVLTIAARRTNAFRPEELRLLEESANDLAYGIETLRTRAAHDAARDALWRTTHLDASTGLPNETAFTETMVAAIGAAEERQERFALLQIDIERLREINDAFGFAHGDELLRQFAARLRDTLPATTTLARLRGDEFAALIPAAGVGDAMQVAKRLEPVLAKPYRIADIPLDVPSHTGIAVFPDHGATPHDLFRHMDIAMQSARQKGVACMLFDPQRHRENPRRLAMAGELRQAIDHGDLRLYLQPKFDVRRQRISGTEALVRWQHATRGLIAPGEFISLAEHTGLIRPLTDWVIESTLELVHGAQGLNAGLPVAVNISVRNLREEELPEKIARAHLAWGVPTGLLEIEITEGAVMEDAEHALQVLQRLRDTGIPLYIDDFGVGYSSLSYLQKLPVHAIKIDQSFVSRMTTDPDSAVIVRSTIDLIHDLGRLVVAEGVENRATFEQLETLGCDIVQGYYVGRPMPAEKFPGWLARFSGPGESDVQQM